MTAEEEKSKLFSILNLRITSVKRENAELVADLHYVTNLAHRFLDEAEATKNEHASPPSYPHETDRVSSSLIIEWATLQDDCRSYALRWVNRPAYEDSEEHRADWAPINERINRLRERMLAHSKWINKKNDSEP